MICTSKNKNKINVRLSLCESQFHSKNINLCFLFHISCLFVTIITEFDTTFDSFIFRCFEKKMDKR